MGRASCTLLSPHGVKVWTVTPWLGHGPSARLVCEKHVMSNPKPCAESRGEATLSRSVLRQPWERWEERGSVDSPSEPFPSSLLCGRASVCLQAEASTSSCCTSVGELDLNLDQMGQNKAQCSMRLAASPAPTADTPGTEMTTLGRSCDGWEVAAMKLSHWSFAWMAE